MRNAMCCGAAVLASVVFIGSMVLWGTVHRRDAAERIRGCPAADIQCEMVPVMMARVQRCTCVAEAGAGGSP